MSQDFCTAWAIVFPEREIPPPSGIIPAIRELAAQVTQAFSTVMPMRFPRAAGAPPPTAAPPDGIGWLPRLIGRMGVAHLDTPLDQLFILSAASLEGAECAGEDYRERETSDPTDQSDQPDPTDLPAP